MDTLRINQEGKRKKEEATGMESETENSWSKIVGRKKKERERWKKPHKEVKIFTFRKRS